MGKDTWPDWEIFVQDECQCVYCGLDGMASIAAWRQLVVEHLIPRVEGGADTAGNKVVSCLRCNMTKADYDPRGYGASSPKYSEPPNDEERARLIGRAWQYINRDPESDNDYGLMLDEIARKASKQHGAP